MGRIVVGTSSWADPGFVEEWYPPGLPAQDRLPFYAERFEGVEVNSTWYGLPSRRTVERWVEATPDGFTFDVKLHKLLTRHAAGPESLPKELRDHLDLTPRGRVVLTPGLQEDLLERTLDAVRPLADAGRLSSFLLQLSPAFAPDRHELDELAPVVQHLAPVPTAIELRHFAWLSGERKEPTLRWLREHQAAFVGVDAPFGRAPTLLRERLDAVTHPQLAYLRAHGRDAEAWTKGRSVAERFAYDYSDDELEEIGARARGLAAEVEQVRLQFNNNRGADAPRAAARMRELLGSDVHA